MLTVRLIAASIWRQRPLYLLWVLSLGAAVTGLMIIDVYRLSLSHTLQTQGTKILTADVAVSVRRAFTEDERSRFYAEWPPNTRYSEMFEMFAMVSSPGESRLAMLRFVDDGFPLIGDLHIHDGSVSSSSHGRDLAAIPVVWVAQDLLTLMGLKLGDSLQVGKTAFTIAGTVAKDSSQTFRMGNMAPRLYAHRKFLDGTGLVQFGSTFTNSLYAALPGSTEGIKRKLEEKFPDPSIQVTVPADLEQGSLRALSRLLDYLGLVGLVTLALGWVGVYYLGRRWLLLEQASGGLLKCLGLTAAELRRLWSVKLTIILSAGVLLGAVGAWSGSHLVAPLFKSGLPDDFQLIWSWRSSFLLLLVGPGLGWLLLSGGLISQAHSPPLQLIGRLDEKSSSGRRWIGSLLGFVVLAIVLTLLQARSWMVSGIFLGALAGSVGLVIGLAFLLLRSVGRFRSSKQGWLWHTASALWLRRRAVAVLLISVSALTGLLSQLIPHLQKTIVGELRAPPASERPGIFLFDVQDEQVQPLVSKLEQHGIEVSQKSPFIRARLIKVNGQEFERSEVGSFSTREEEVDARMRNRGVNLTFREQLGPAETVVEGKAYDQLSIAPAEISVEQRYARRLGLEMGDDLLFDVQGVEIPAKIANFREVNWDSFQPNFFMQFKPGVIDEAPKTWIFTLKRHPELSVPQMQRLLAKDFPNVTSINVEEALDAVTGMVGTLGSGLRTASLLTLALGIFVFVMILMFQMISSERDWLQLHRQGLKDRELLSLQLLSYGALSFAGALLGSALSLIVCWVLAKWALDMTARFDWFGMLQILAVTIGFSAAALIWLSRWQFRQMRSRYGDGTW